MWFLNLNNYSMEHNISIKFAKDYTQYNKIIKLGVDYDGNTFIIFPLYVYYVDDFGHEQLLFDTSFKFYTKLNKWWFNRYRDELDYGNAEPFFKKFFPQSTIISDIKAKADKWVSNEVVEPLIYVDEYNSNSEFLEVDDNTDFYGCFNHNSKRGCHLYYSANKNVTQINSLHFHIEVSSYDIPDKFTPYGQEFHNKFYTFSDLDKLKYLKSKEDECLFTTIRTAINDYADKFDSRFLPYYICLYGNDDYSVSKFFMTEEAMNNEINRLRRCQPLNYQMDILSQGYQ